MASKRSSLAGSLRCRGRRTALLPGNKAQARLPLLLLSNAEARGRAAEQPYVLTLIVYERERRALGSFLAPSAHGAASCSSRRRRRCRCCRRRRRPESLPAQLRPPGSASEPPGTVTAGAGRAGKAGERGLRGVGLRPRVSAPEGPCGLRDPGERLRGARDGEAAGERRRRRRRRPPRLARPPLPRCTPYHDRSPARQAAGMGDMEGTVAASSARREGLRRPRPPRGGARARGDRAAAGRRPLPGAHPVPVGDEEGRVATSTSPATVSWLPTVFLEENMLADGRMEGRAASTARLLRG